jgi:hypothetical protein
MIVENNCEEKMTLAIFNPLRNNPGFCLEVLRKITKNLRIAGIRAEI